MVSIHQPGRRHENEYTTSSLYACSEGKKSTAHSRKGARSELAELAEARVDRALPPLLLAVGERREASLSLGLREAEGWGHPDPASATAEASSAWHRFPSSPSSSHFPRAPRGSIDRRFRAPPPPPLARMATEAARPGQLQANAREILPTCTQTAPGRATRVWSPFPTGPRQSRYHL